MYKGKCAVYPVFINLYLFLCIFISHKKGSDKIYLPKYCTSNIPNDEI